MSAAGVGTLTYAGTRQTFSGTITCIDRVGNPATIVAHDAARGQFDRTQVQDGGTTNDKIINTLFDPTKHTAAYDTRMETCGAPDLTALGAAQALSGDQILLVSPPTPGL